MRIRQSIFVVALLSLPLAAFAQTKAPDYDAMLPKRFISEIELNAGLGFGFLRGGAEVDGSVDHPYDPALSYYGGLGLTHVLSEKFVIAGLVYFERTGGIINRMVTYFDQESQSLKRGKLETNYKYYNYSIAILTRYKIRNFKIGFGPYLSYLDKQLATSSFAYAMAGTDDETQYNRNWDFGISLEVKYEIYLSNKFSLSVGVVDNFGITNTRSLSYYHGETMKLNNTSFLCSIIYKR